MRFVLVSDEPTRGFGIRDLCPGITRPLPLRPMVKDPSAALCSVERFVIPLRAGCERDVVTSVPACFLFPAFRPRRVEPPALFESLSCHWRLLRLRVSLFS